MTRSRQIGIFVALLIGFVGLVVLKSFTGFVVLDDNQVMFDWGGEWEMNESLIRVSQEMNVYDIPVISVVHNNLITIDLDNYNLTDGEVYVDLIINETVIDSVLVSYITPLLNDTIPPSLPLPENETEVDLGDEGEEVILAVGEEVIGVMDATNPPTHSTPILNSSNGLNNTYANLTVYNVSTADLDGDDVKNIYNWYKNGISLALVNMPFENNGSNQGGKDYSGYGNNLTGALGDPIWNSTGGYDGAGAYEFDGSGDILNLGDIDLMSSSGSDIISASLWFKESGVHTYVSAHSGIIGKNNEFFFGFHSTNQELTIGTYGSNIDGASCANLVQDEWYHIYYEYNEDTNNLSIYLNGELNCSGASSDNSGNSVNPLYFGEDGAGGGACVNGTIDDVMIFNYSLSPEQIRAIYVNKNNKIVKEETDVGETWNATVTPNDGYVDGTPLSNSLVVINNLPTHSTPILNSTLGTNFTSENLSVYNVSTADLDGDDVKNIYNWYKNGTSITVLNAPLEADGNLNGRDYSNWGNNMSHTIGNPVWGGTSGYDGKGAYVLDGSGDCLDFSSGFANFQKGDSFAMSYWVKTNDGTGTMIGKWELSVTAGWLLDSSSSYPNFGMYDSGGSNGFYARGSTTITSNTWKHIVMSYNGTNGSGVQIYLNGARENMVITTLGSGNPGTLGDSNVTIGCRKTDNYELAGTVDDVMIFNNTLTAEQVLALYENRTNFIHNTSIGLDETWNVTITPNDGNGDGNTLWSNSVTIRGNSAPIIDSVNVTSSDANNYTNGTLTGAWNQSDVDNDAITDNETKWWNGATLNTTFANFTSIESANLTKGDVWNFSVRVYDDIEWGAWSSNASMTIANAPPTVLSVVMNSTDTNNYSNGSLQLSWVINDIDSDSETDNETKWTKDGVLQPLTNLTTIDSGNLTKGNVWNVSVRVYDGSDWSSWSSNVSITIVNRVPTVDSFNVTSGSSLNYSNGTLTGAWNQSDVDNDAFTDNETKWWNGATLNTTFANFTSIESANLSVGDVWNFSVRVFDGEDWSSWSSNASITIANRVPTVDTVNVTSSDANNYTNGTLTGAWNQSDVDNNAITDNETKWWNGNVLNTTFANFTSIQSANLTKGDVWNFSVRVYDGSDWSSWGANASITIANYVPSHSTPVINSTLGTNYTNENLTVFNVSTTDANGDNVKNIYNWYKDSTSVTLLNIPMEGDTNSSNAKDYSDNGNNGTVNSATWTSTGGYDGFGAYDFDGLTNYIDVGNSPTLNVSDAFTMVAWVKADSSVPGGDSFAIVSKRNAAPYWHWRLGVGGSHLMLINNGTSLSTSSGSINSLDTGVWHHLAVTKSGTDVSFYVDGKFDRTQTSVPGSIVNSNNIFIGKYNVAGAGFFNGTIDDLMMFNRSLSVEQIQALYANQSNRIVQQETAIGEVWNATVTPNDGTTDGAILWCESITIANNAPTVDSVNVTSSSSFNYSNGTLTGAWNQSDANNDAITDNETKWWNGNVLNTTFANFTSVQSANLSVGDVWNFSIRVYDGSGGSSWSSNVSVTIANRVPTVNISINSTNVNNDTSGDLYVNWTFSDDDGASETDNETKWTKDGANQSLNNYSIVDSGNFTAGEVWNVSVRVYDGSDWSSWSDNMSITMVSANTAPTVDTVNVTSSDTNNYSNGTLTGAWNQSDADNEGIIDNETQWWNDNVLNTTFANFTNVQAANLTKGDVWNFSVRVYDGTVWSGWSANSSVSVVNSPPTAASLVLNSTDVNNYSNGTLQISWTISDGDSDSETDNETKWTKDGANQSLNNLTSIVSGNLTKNEVWNVSVRVYDGSVWGGWSENVSITLANMAPVVDTVNVTSSSSFNYSNGTLTGAWNQSDADNDAFTDNETKWWNGNVLNTTFANFTSIESANLTKGDVWNFSVRVYDGESWSGWSSNVSITIVNRVPTVNISMASTNAYNYTTGDLFVNWTFSDDDGDSETDNETKWTKDGANQSLNNNSVIESANLSAGETWNVSARVYDGEDWSSWSANSSVSVVAVPVADEEETTSSSSGGGGGGSGGMGREETIEEEVENFEEVYVSVDSFNIDAVEGFEIGDSFKIVNEGEEDIEILLELIDVDGIIVLEDQTIVLAPGESRWISFDINPTEAGIYTATIRIQYLNQILNIPIAINVDSEQALFDISLDILGNFKTIAFGKKVVGQIFLLQAGKQEKEDVTLNYVVKDFEGNTLLSESETVAVFKQKLFSKSLPTQELPEGNYLWGVEVVYSGGIATASSQFSIVEDKLNNTQRLLLGILIASGLTFISLIIIIEKYKRFNIYNRRR